MKILFTGASSFTGMHFVLALLRDGHEVHCTFTPETLKGYEPIIQVPRIGNFIQHTTNHFGAAFGSERFIELLDLGFDAVCHHGSIGQSASRSVADFDVPMAVENNTRNAAEVMRALARARTRQFIFTGTYFQSRPPWSPNEANTYALSKSLSTQLLRFFCGQSGINFRNFVVPNPFGPYENIRFTSSAVLAWAQGKPFHVRTPDVVRDNIHVSQLANCYAKFLIRDAGSFYPSGYVGTQLDFAVRFAREIGPRLGLSCPLTFGNEKEEPPFRGNSEDPDDLTQEKFIETLAWDALAEYYREHLFKNVSFG